MNQTLKTQGAGYMASRKGQLEKRFEALLPPSNLRIGCKPVLEEKEPATQPIWREYGTCLTRTWRLTLGILVIQSSRALRAIKGLESKPERGWLYSTLDAIARQGWSN
jgi:hypothetical protein